jgi:hypothetical protein
MAHSRITKQISLPSLPEICQVTKNKRAYKTTTGMLRGLFCYHFKENQLLNDQKYKHSTLLEVAHDKLQT